MQLTFIHTPSHGFLQVGMQILKQLGINNRISQFSYITPRFCLLEEDCDTATLLKALELAGHAEIDLVEKWIDEDVLEYIGEDYSRFTPKEKIKYAGKLNIKLNWKE